ncbi:MAG: response regulator [Chitinophagaceae bacterium]
MEKEPISKSFRIWIADDDFEDFQLIKRILEEDKINVHLSHVEDGQYLIDILKAQSKYITFGELPNLILLDLNMPRKNGLEVLKELKEHKVLCRIPIIIFTTSKTIKDIEKAYELGASCYVTKPQTGEEWFTTLGFLSNFWINCVKYAI